MHLFRHIWANIIIGKNESTAITGSVSPITIFRFERLISHAGGEIHKCEMGTIVTIMRF